MSSGVGVFLASYLQNRSERYTHRGDPSTNRQESNSVSGSEFQKMLNMAEGVEDIPFSEWKMFFDALSEQSHGNGSFISENDFESVGKKRESKTGVQDRNRFLIKGMKSERLLMMSKLQNPIRDSLRAEISSKLIGSSSNGAGDLIGKESMEWMKLFGHVNVSEEFMSYASDNFQSGASKHRKSKIPSAGENPMVQERYDAYKFFSVSNVEKMMRNNYRPQSDIRILDLSL